jgi:hypothetical protein
MWWLSRRIREEREHACDDHALTADADAIALAEALAELAHNRQPSQRLLLAANGSPLMNRVARLLSSAPTPARSWAPIGLISFLATSAVLAAQLAPSYPVNAKTFSGTLQTPSLSAQEAEQAERGREQALRDRDQAKRDAEQALRDSQAVAQREQTGQAQWDLGHSTGRTGHFADSKQATQAIVRLVAADPSVTSKLGSPVAVTANMYTGRWGFNENAGLWGDVRISFGLTGPKGQATILVSAVAMRTDKQWKLTKLDVTDFKPAR